MSNSSFISGRVSGPRVLVFSLRNIFKKDLYRCPHFEFENTIADIDRAEIVAPAADPTSRRNLLAKRLAFHGPVVLKAEIEKVEVNQHYDLFFALCGSPRDLLMLDAASHLLDACSIKVCMIDELWIKQMHEHRYYLNILKNFDLVVLYYSQSTKPLSARIGRKCVFIPPGIDALRFCPYPGPLERVVDVYSVGRRSQTTHQAILKMADEQKMFYLHDSIDGTVAINASEHRGLFASVAKRSKYFIVNPGLIDRPDVRGDQIEIGNRYFEGAASGMIMIGEIPGNGEFEKLFDWPDAVLHLPYGSEEIEPLIRGIEDQPQRQENFRRTNVYQALKRHDWAYRWESILHSAGLESTPELARRKERLARLAEEVISPVAADKLA